jgi:hypothetical protein
MPRRAADDEDTFDAASFFESVVPDENIQAKRQAEFDARVAAAKAAAEALAEKRRTDEERMMLRMIAEERRYEERLEREEAANRLRLEARERHLAAERRSLPARLKQIKAEELRVNGPPPALPGAPSQLYMPSHVAAEIRRALEAHTMTLPEPFPMDHDESESDDNAFDSYFSSHHAVIGQMVHHMHKAEKLDTLFKTHEDIGDLQVGRQYIDACYDLKNALDEGLYRYDVNLARDLQIPIVLRLRSYYQSTVWGAYNEIDLADGWAKLLQLALLIEPSKCDTKRYLDAIRTTIKRYEAALGRLQEHIEHNSTTGARSGDERVIRNALKEAERQLREDSNTMALCNALAKRYQRIRDFISVSPRDVEAQNISEEVVTACAHFFVDHPNDPNVVLIRNVAFGHQKIGFDRIGHAWWHAIDEMPASMLSPYGTLYRRACNLIGR